MKSNLSNESLDNLSAYCHLLGLLPKGSKEELIEQLAGLLAAAQTPEGLGSKGR